MTRTTSPSRTSRRTTLGLTATSEAAALLTDSSTPVGDALLRKLRPSDITVAIGIETTAKIGTVAAAISKASRYTFEAQGDQDHGYPLFRAKLPGASNWAFMTPNVVRRGFVRRADAKDVKVRKEHADQVERFREHPDCNYFVTADFGTAAGGKLSRAIEKLPYPSRRVRLAD
ncbi:MAG: hypothetical protein JWP01_2556 [Myxococcales bacterium]|nr:hypothetical protein [Myxococcales bacterium]